MNTETATATATPAAAAPVAAATPAPVVTEEITAALKLIDGISRNYWPPGELGKAQESIGKLVEAANVVKLAVVYSFDIAAEFPAGYGLSISPITKNDATKGRVKIGILVGAMPDPDTLMTHEKGPQFARDIVIKALQAQLNNAVRPRSDGTKAATIPFTIDDFITSARAQESMGTWRELAPFYVKFLKSKGFTMTTQILRQIFTSAAFAKQQYPNLTAEKWSGLLDVVLEDATAAKKDPGILQYWKETRDTVKIDTGDFDLDSLGSLVREPVAETAETEETAETAPVTA